MLRLRTSLAIAVLSLFVGACSSSTPKHALSDGCTLNSDCADTLVCTFGRCHAACEATKDCPTGQSCIKASDGAKVCQLPVEVNCQTGGNCATPLTCGLDGKCRGQCMANSDCTSGQKCTTSGTCAEPAQVDSNNNLIVNNDAGVGGSSNTGGSSGTGGGSAVGGSTSEGGNTAAGGITNAGGASNIGGASNAGGMPSSGGASNGGGATSTGGTSNLGGTANSGGASNMGGNVANGGNPGTGGAAAGGGSSTTGGKTGTGGTLGLGGTTSTGGTKTTGGTSSTGGANPTGGRSSNGGTAATGGVTSTGGSSANICTLSGAPTVPPSSGLVAYYPFDGSARDASLYQNHAREHGTITYAAGLAGQAASFNGTDAYIEAHDATWLHFGTGSFTVAAWVKTNGASTAPIVDKGAPTLTAEGAFHALVSTGAARLAIQSVASGGDYKDVRSTSRIDDGAWHHVVAIRDATNQQLKLYVDGAQAATPAADTGIGNIDSARALLIGGDAGGTRFKGLIDEVYLYNRAVSAAEVSALYTSCGTPATPPCANIVKYDARDDFDAGWQSDQNPNGVWSYGWSTGLAGSLHPFADQTTQTQPSCAVTAWYDAQNWQYTTPFVERNTGSDCSDGNIVYDAGALLMHPGGLTFTSYVHVVFAAPANGYYYFSGGYFPQQNGIDVDINTRVAGSPVLQGALTGMSGYHDFYGPWALAQGESVDFAVGPDFNNSSHPGSTRLEAHVSACIDPVGSTPTCSDGIRNQDESDVDCGGTHCSRCVGGKVCTLARDCASGACVLSGTGGTYRCIGDQLRASCQAYIDAGQNAGDGAYGIDPDGNGPTAPFAVYCDMTQHHGGWALVGRLGQSVDASNKGQLTLDRNPQQLLLGTTPLAAEFSNWDLGRFDAWGRTWTVRTSTDTSNDGSHFQYTFYRPADGEIVLPSQAGSNWLGTNTNSQLVHLTMSTTTGLSNTTWLAVPGWDANSGEQLIMFGYRVAANASPCPACLTSDGQTQICHAPAGVLGGQSGATGTFMAACGYLDGSGNSWGHRATYWIKDVNAPGTP